MTWLDSLGSPVSWNAVHEVEVCTLHLNEGQLHSEHLYLHLYLLNNTCVSFFCHLFFFMVRLHFISYEFGMVAKVPDSIIILTLQRLLLKSVTAAFIPSQEAQFWHLTQMLKCDKCMESFTNNFPNFCSDASQWPDKQGSHSQTVLAHNRRNTLYFCVC